jgi:hypothetical protein
MKNIQTMLRGSEIADKVVARLKVEESKVVDAEWNSCAKIFLRAPSFFDPSTTSSTTFSLSIFLILSP